MPANDKIWVKGRSPGGYSTHHRAVVTGTRHDGSRRYLQYMASGRGSDGRLVSWRGEQRLDLSWADAVRRRLE